MTAPAGYQNSLDQTAPNKPYPAILAQRNRTGLQVFFGRYIRSSVSNLRKEPYRQRRKERARSETHTVRLTIFLPTH